jgi:hypothetical protein
MKNRCYIVTMNRQSAKTAKRSPKIAGKTAAKSSAPAVKKASKGEKTARGADKKASKSARSPVGKMAETARALMGAARASKAAAAAAAVKSVTVPAATSAAKIMRTVSPPVQPAAPEIVLKSHKYQVGEAVYFTSPTFGRAAASGSYTVVKLLPSESDDYQYRIKSSGEAFERVAKESQLEKI